MDWFKFYPGRFLIGAAHLSNEEAGCYIRLLCSQALKGSLPADFKKLSHIAGGMSEDTWHAIIDKFPVDEDGLRYNPRLRQVAQEAKTATEAARESGRKGGLARAAKAKASNPSSDPTSLAQQTEKQTNREINTSFPEHNPDDIEMEKLGWSKLLSEEFQVDRVRSLQAINQCFLRHDPVFARQWLKENLTRCRSARSPSAYLAKILKSEFGL
jgi:uncharacterized protein YdaU (DUF1376 family)